jgi:CCR4-NOT transcription complex subunit 1
MDFLRVCSTLFLILLVCRALLDYTYASIEVLLSSDTIITSSQERSLLKNLGSWLGMMTIKRNQPPLARRIKFKDIVVDAFDRGRLIAVVPFVAKVLVQYVPLSSAVGWFLMFSSSCSDSRVFRPPNPWLMSLVSLLAEIYRVAEIKLNLKFEIEVLFNKLGISLKDVPIRNYLVGVNVNQQSNQNFRQQQPISAQGHPQVTILNPHFGQCLTTAIRQLAHAAAGAFHGSPSPLFPQHVASQQTHVPPQQAPVSSVYQGTLDSSFPPSESPYGMSDAAAPVSPQIPQQYIQKPLLQQVGTSVLAFAALTSLHQKPGVVTIRSDIALFANQPRLRQCVSIAVDRAINEIISPVVERSVHIACITTRELILKDFAMDSDEHKV